MNKEQYDKLIEAGVAPFGHPDQHARFVELVAAYKRGFEWCVENGEDREYLAKAAHDYADKITSAKTPQ